VAAELEADAGGRVNGRRVPARDEAIILAKMRAGSTHTAQDGDFRVEFRPVGSRVWAAALSAAGSMPWGLHVLSTSRCGSSRDERTLRWLGAAFVVESRRR